MENIRGSSFGRMSLAHYQATKDLIFKPCLKKLDRPKFQYLPMANGQTQDWQNCLSVKLRGACLTLNIGESPSVARESFLSQILEDNAPEKYYLSEKACLGILRRAKERGKELPEELRIALERQASRLQSTDRKIENGGNGNGVLAETAYTLDTIDRHAVATIYGAKSYSEYERGKVAAIRASGGNYGGGSENLALSYSVVRRLTPTESERLNGLEDGYTDIEFKGKPASDSNRYKAIGNGMAKPCSDYIISRIVNVLKSN